MDFNFSDRVKNLSGNAIREIFKVLQDKEMISFAGGFPSSLALAPKDVAAATERLMESDGIKILQYGATGGYEPLRETLVGYFDALSITSKLENNLVISGGQQAIDLAFKCLTNKGDKILVQSPTYLAALHIAKTYEILPVGVKGNTDGIDLNDLEEKIKNEKPKLLYLVPTFHNPTGQTMSEENRKAVAFLTAKYNLVVLEDDPYRELRYSGTPLLPIKSYDKTGNVVYVSSFSKVVSPGLRVGALVGDEKLVAKFNIAKQAVDVHTSNLSQAIINDFITRGTLLKNIEKAIPIYREKLSSMLTAIAQFMPQDFSYTKPQGGLFVWGEFSKESGVLATEIFQQSLAKKVAFVSGVDFFPGGTGERNLRLNFSNATTEQIFTGIERLSKVVKENSKN